MDQSFYLTLFAMFCVFVTVLALFSPKSTDVLKIVCDFLIALLHPLQGLTIPQGAKKPHTASAKEEVERDTDIA